MAKTKILLIEHDPQLAKMYKTAFESQGYDLWVAYHKKQILELLKQHQPDFLIIDKMINDTTTGVGLLQNIYKKTKIKKIPCLFLYKLSNKEMKQAQSLGVKDSFDQIDFSPIQMIEKVKQYLKN